MKIRSVTIGDALIFLLIASSNGTHQKDQVPNGHASYNIRDIKTELGTGIAGSIYHGKNRAQGKYNPHHLDLKP